MDRTHNILKYVPLTPRQITERAQRGLGDQALVERVSRQIEGMPERDTEALRHAVQGGNYRVPGELVAAGMEQEALSWEAWRSIQRMEDFERRRDAILRRCSLPNEQAGAQIEETLCICRRGAKKDLEGYYDFEDPFCDADEARSFHEQMRREGAMMRTALLFLLGTGALAWIVYRYLFG